jgi:competence protein ComEA
MGILLAFLLFLHSAHSTPFAATKNLSHPRPVNTVELIDINRADLKTLQQLKGIGEKKAKDIIALRQKNHGFHSIEDIKTVKGIGKKLFNQIKKKIMVGSF